MNTVPDILIAIGLIVVGKILYDQDGFNRRKRDNPGQVPVGELGCTASIGCFLIVIGIGMISLAVTGLSLVFLFTEPWM